MRCCRMLVLGLLPLTLISCRCEKDKKKTAETDPEQARSTGVELQLPAVLARPAFAQSAGGKRRQVTLSDIAERAVKSVVNISSTRRVRRPRGMAPYGNPFFDHFYRHRGVPRERRARSLGSGVVVSADGVVVTNNHVVREAQQIEVVFADGHKQQAELVGTDPKSDLAVLRLKGEVNKLTPIPLGESGKLRLGEIVLAIGNPFGVGQTVTMGIVSALGRANVGIVDYEDFIQTDAAINPGNSGGALVNMRGELVGINTAILSRTGGYQGIGFAIPSAMVKPIKDSLIKHGRVIRGWLGIVIQDLTEDIARAMGLSVKRGVLVADVQPGSPAAEAGLRRGDVITALDGKPTASVARLRNRVASSGADREIKLEVVRDGKRREFSAKLGVLPGDRVAKLDTSQGVLGGLTVVPLTAVSRQRLGLPQQASGVHVKAVQPRSAADAAGLRVDDVLLEINRRAVSTPAEFTTLYRRARGKVLLLVYRQGSSMYLLLEK